VLFPRLCVQPWQALPPVPPPASGARQDRHRHHVHRRRVGAGRAQGADGQRKQQMQADGNTDRGSQPPVRQGIELHG
jgi:hypothetical protein